jgi:hypothetical protein
MAEEIRHLDGRIEHPSVRHEPTDASFRWILGVVLGAGALGVIILLVILAYFNHSREALATARKSRFPLAAKPSWSLPPEPRLEQLDRLAGVTSADVLASQQAKLERLDSLGPVDEKGFVHIPINRAMALLANKLPARSGERQMVGVYAAGTFGLLSGPSGPGPLVAAAALFPGRSRVETMSLQRRDSGLVGGGTANSGRLFNRRPPR